MSIDSKSRSRTGRMVVVLGSAYSTYEFLSQGKSLELGTPSTKYENTIPWDVTLETLLSFAVLTLGCALTTPAFRKIAWNAEVRTE